MVLRGSDALIFLLNNFLSFTRHKTVIQQHLELQLKQSTGIEKRRKKKHIWSNSDFVQNAHFTVSIKYTKKLLHYYIFDFLLMFVHVKIRDHFIILIIRIKYHLTCLIILIKHITVFLSDEHKEEGDGNRYKMPDLKFTCLYELDSDSWTGDECVLIGAVDLDNYQIKRDYEISKLLCF
ncbi:hypothetical protein ACJX0J_017777 [Zea mays]